MKKNFWFLFLFAALVLFDQLTKIFFQEESTCNPDLAWSIRIAPGFFYLLWTLLIIFLIVLFRKQTTGYSRFSFILVFSGAVSNFIDRMAHGCVTDFIDLGIWPVFNLADAYITTGIVIFAIIIIINENHEATL